MKCSNRIGPPQECSIGFRWPWLLEELPISRPVGTVNAAGTVIISAPARTWLETAVESASRNRQSFQFCLVPFEQRPRSSQGHGVGFVWVAPSPKATSKMDLAILCTSFPSGENNGKYCTRVRMSDVSGSVPASSQISRDFASSASPRKNFPSTGSASSNFSASEPIK